MSGPEYEDILRRRELRAKELRKRFFNYLENKFSFAFPLNTLKLAKELNVEIFDKNIDRKQLSPLFAFLPFFDDSHAFSGWNGDLPEIFYNSCLEDRENIYLVAHELSHLLFPDIAGIKYIFQGNQEYTVRDSSLSPIVEDILMPQSLFKHSLHFPLILSFDLFFVPMIDLLLKILHTITDRSAFLLIGDSRGLHLVAISLPHLKLFKQTYVFYKLPNERNIFSKERDEHSQKNIVFTLIDSLGQHVYMKDHSSFNALAQELVIIPKLADFIKYSTHYGSNNLLSTNYYVKMDYQISFEDLDNDVLNYPARRISFCKQDFMVYSYFLRKYSTRFCEFDNYYVFLAIQDKDLRYFPHWLKGNDAILPDDRFFHPGKIIDTEKFIDIAPYKDVPLFKQQFIAKLKAWELFYEKGYHKHIITDIFKEP